MDASEISHTLKLIGGSMLAGIVTIAGVSTTVGVVVGAVVTLVAVTAVLNRD